MNGCLLTNLCTSPLEGQADGDETSLPKGSANAMQAKDDHAHVPPYVALCPESRTVARAAGNGHEDEESGTRAGFNAGTPTQLSNGEMQTSTERRCPDPDSIHTTHSIRYAGPGYRRQTEKT